jgi:MYXO-CTERM domain-containing protein
LAGLLLKKLPNFKPPISEERVDDAMRRLLWTIPFFAAALAAYPTRAEACGGFFCGGTPIDQTGEKIAFAVKDGKITAQVLIQYAGNAKDFAWIVPVASKPTLSVGSTALFNYLEMATRPYFYPQWDYNPMCGGGGYYGLAENDSATAGGPPRASAGKGVEVVAREEVGPYDAAILKATDATSLMDWLKDNKYDIPAGAKEPIAGYVGKDAHFVALKLQQDKGVGDLAPISLTFEEARPCVPIRLTRIAAQPNMGITAFVLSDRRAIPENYKHVLINETRIDWMKYGANYDKVVSEAINEAGGLAFATEFAGKLSAFGGSRGVLFSQGRFAVARLKTFTTPWDFVAELLRQGFPRDAQMQNLLRKHIPMPESLKKRGVNERSFYNNLRAYKTDLVGQKFDAVAFADELEAVVIKPLREAQAMLDQSPYLTRLYTTMDPNEMVVDPTFNFNRDLPDVSNMHTAKVSPICSGLSSQRYDPHQLVRVELKNGTVYYTYTDAGPLEIGPYAERIEQLPTAGEPLVLTDNLSIIATGVGSTKRPPPRPIDTPPTPPSGGCSAATGGGARYLLPLAALGMAAFRRRRSGAVAR